MTTRQTMLIFGESNALGFNSLSPAQSYPNASSVYKMGPDFQVAQASDPIVSGWQIGPGMGFGDERVNQVASVETCLILGLGLKAADWQPATAAFSICMKAAQQAEAIWGPVIGLLWVQGLNNAQAADYTSGAINAWPLDVWRVFANVRLFLNKPELPIVVSGLPANPGGTNGTAWTQIQNFISAMPNEIPNLTTITLSDLAVNSGDASHWTAASQVTHGRRAATALQGML